MPFILNTSHSPSINKTNGNHLVLPWSFDPLSWWFTRVPDLHSWIPLLFSAVTWAIYPTCALGVPPFPSPAPDILCKYCHCSVQYSIWSMHASDYPSSLPRPYSSVRMISFSQKGLIATQYQQLTIILPAPTIMWWEINSLRTASIIASKSKDLNWQGDIMS